LAGFDHEHDAGQMARKENRLRRQLKLEAALIERAGVSAAGRSKRRSLGNRRRAAKRRSA
jgi:probable rRNA maturation factor